MKQKDLMMLLGVGGVAIAFYYLNQSGALQSVGLPQATPYSIYPEYAYTAQTSMQASPGQQNTTAPLPPIPQYTAVQAAEASAIQTQCAGASVCSPTMGDMELL